MSGKDDIRAVLCTVTFEFVTQTVTAVGAAGVITLDDQIPATTTTTTTITTTTTTTPTTTTTLPATTTTALGAGAGVPTTLSPILPNTGSNDSNVSVALLGLLLVLAGGSTLAMTRRR